MLLTIVLPILVFFLILGGLVFILGEYIAWIFRKETDTEDATPRFLRWLTKYIEKPIFIPVEKTIYTITGIDPNKKMDWTRYFLAALLVNLLIFILIFIIFSIQGMLPLNPAHAPGMSWDLAFHSAATFTANTNQQHYAGEIDLTYLSQIFASVFAMFISAATGLALVVGFTRGFLNRENPDLGNFYSNLVKGLVRFLIPASLILAIFLISQGVPQTLSGPAEANTLEGGMQLIARGPVAVLEAIKMIGTNGGGFFGANAAHPFENPSPLTNLVLNLLLLATPMAIVYSFGIWLKKRLHGLILLSAITVIFIILLGLGIWGETGPNPALAQLNIDHSLGNMEGKETRFGSVLSALWGVSTTSTASGAVNSMHDSFTPLGSIPLFLGMSMNSLFGGVGTGLMNLITYVLIGVFIAGLMIGRAPGYMGKKVESGEIKIAAMIILLLPTLVLFPASVAFITEAGKEAVTNPGYHGFSQILYEFFSAATNNGSGFEGLVDNSIFYNLSCGLVILLARFLPIAGQLAIAGSLAGKKIRPETKGTLKTETPAFLLLFIGVMIIIGGLIFMPALALGPIAEFLGMWGG